MVIAGVDGCHVGWVYVAMQPDSNALRSGCVPLADDLLTIDPPLGIICIDIPIGLPERGPRVCDVEARRRLGPRRSSVFPAPIRRVLDAGSHEDASSRRKEAEGKGMTRQAWGIVKKVREVDKLMRTVADARERILEVHPEITFCAWAGAPMLHAKKTRDGREERQRLVATHFGNDAFPRARNTHPRKMEVADDDILDAFAALWTAQRVLQRRHRNVPENPPIDSFGLPMQIVF